MRKLASIQIIHDILPIPDADRIELVRVLGWQCVAKKGEFQKGDKCVYFEIDSFLPIQEEFEFLRPSSYKNSEILGKGFRLKTQTFRGEISQGLVLPLSTFGFDPEIATGTDVTKTLHVKKWEIKERAATGGTVISELPDFIPHSDETRIQTCPEIIKELQNDEYYITTKIDGSSHALGIDKNGNIHVTGHNFEYKDDGKSSFYEFIKKRGILENLKKNLPQIEKAAKCSIETIAIIGEFCGPGIQRNRLKLTRPEWYVFTVNINGIRCGLLLSVQIAEIIDAKFVPVEEVDRNFMEHYPDEQAVLKRAEGQYPNGGQKEGIVIRTTIPKYSKTLNGHLSFKAVSNRYLLKND